MPRTIGSKNKQPSRRDLTSASLSQIKIAIGVFIDMVQNNQIKEHQKPEVLELITKMKHTLDSGKRWIKESNCQL